MLGRTKSKLCSDVSTSLESLRSSEVGSASLDCISHQDIAIGGLRKTWEKVYLIDHLCPQTTALMLTSFRSSYA